jgi:hypothetical protein
MIGSSNPFFIAVCAPDTYNGGGGGGGGSSTPRTNVFLRSSVSGNSGMNRRNGGGGGGGSSFTSAAVSSSSSSSSINHFIHHPAIQNDRKRDHYATAGAAAGASAAASAATVSATSATDIHNPEHFPSLSTSTTPVVQTKLNFKEMVMKNAGTPSATTAGTAAGTATAAGTSTGTATGAVATTGATNIDNRPRSSLSSGNIFLGAFVGHSNEGGCDGEGDYHEGVSDNRCTFSSILVDSCDNKYDKLYENYA